MAYRLECEVNCSVADAMSIASRSGSFCDIAISVAGSKTKASIPREGPFGDLVFMSTYCTKMRFAGATSEETSRYSDCFSHTPLDR